MLLYQQACLNRMVINFKTKGEKTMKKRNLRFRRAIYGLVCAVLLVSLVFIGCSKKSTEENKTVVLIKTLTAFPASIQKGQSSVVDVMVEDDADRPISGAKVAFSVSPATIGVCSPTVDTTDATGSAATVFTATDFGTATIQANVEGVASKTVEISVVTSGGTTKPLTIELNPAYIKADGISTSQIKVTVSDTTGSLADDNTVVKFSVGEKFEDADGDGYFTEGIDELKYDINHDGRWNQIGFISPYALTQDGEVTINYVSGLRTGAVYLKVTSQPRGNFLQEDAEILLIPTDSVAYIVLLPDQARIQVQGTGGMEATQVRAICYDDYGNRVGSDFPVEFYIINGPGGGEALNGVSSDSITIKTDALRIHFKEVRQGGGRLNFIHSG